MTKKVLLVDDDRELCEEMGEIISAEGYEVDVAHDGLSALELCETNHYDVILLDLKIPGASGFEVLRTVKRNDRKCKVMVLTGRPLTSLPAEAPARATQREEEETLKLSDAVMNKPYDVEDMLEELKTLAHHD